MPDFASYHTAGKTIIEPQIGPAHLSNQGTSAGHQDSLALQGIVHRHVDRQQLAGNYQVNPLVKSVVTQAVLEKLHFSYHYCLALALAVNA